MYDYCYGFLWNKTTIILALPLQTWSAAHSSPPTCTIADPHRNKGMMRAG